MKPNRQKGGYIDIMRDVLAKKKVGIIGGTFNPIHYGHLLAAEAAYEAFELSRVVFIPTGTPPHKIRVMTSAEDRWMMAMLATNDCPHFSVSRVEIDRPGNSYTTDTLMAMRQKPYCEDAEFYFIVGLDALMLVETWKEPRELLNLCKFIAVSRPGYSFDELKKLPDEYQSTILTIEIPRLDISSTDIRTRVRNGESIKFLLPPTVENYIEKYSLYKELTPEE